MEAWKIIFLSNGHVSFQWSKLPLGPPMFLVQCYFQGGYHQNLGVTVETKYGPEKIKNIWNSKTKRKKNTTHNMLHVWNTYLPTFYHQIKRHSYVIHVGNSCRQISQSHTWSVQKGTMFQPGDFLGGIWVEVTVHPASKKSTAYTPATLT